MIDPRLDQWDRVKQELKVGAIQDGVVVNRFPFGAFVDIEQDRFIGLILIPDFQLPMPSIDHLPPIGFEIRAKVIGFKDLGHQICMRYEGSATEDRPYDWPPLSVSEDGLWSRQWEFRMRNPKIVQESDMEEVEKNLNQEEDARVRLSYAEEGGLLNAVITTREWGWSDRAHDLTRKVRRAVSERLGGVSHVQGIDTSEWGSIE